MNDPRIVSICAACGAFLRVEHVRGHSSICPKITRNASGQELSEIADVPSDHCGGATETGLLPDSPDLLNAMMRASAIARGKVPFRLLPPGSWDVDTVISHYRRAMAGAGGRHGKNRFEARRIEMLKRLSPTSCWVGEEGWRGYIVFGFIGSERVVLECPVRNNATYIISGDWTRMVGHSKTYLLATHPDRCTKVIHRDNWDDWLGQVRRAVYGKRRHR